jgi:hypothetical protein
VEVKMTELGTNISYLLLLGMAVLLLAGIMAAILLLVYGLFFKKRQ